MQLATAIEAIQQETSRALGNVRADEIEALLAALTRARRIFVIGTGRVGLAAQAFAMRLMHLGLTAYWIGDASTPAVRVGDLLLVCSGSGETAPMRVLAELAERQGVEIATITREPQATVGRLAKTVVGLLTDEKDGSIATGSVQPMTTLFEQSLFLLLEAVVLLLMERLGQDEALMRERHFNLER
jgi:6-phospho-3-hexuloisomerase